MWARSVTPRAQHDSSHEQLAIGARRATPPSDKIEVAARTKLLKKLIKQGYERLGLSQPTITTATPLEPLLYRQEKVIGKGAFGLVSLCRSVLTGELVAMKTIERAKLHNENLKKTVEHEIRILKRLRHRRIVRLFEVIETPRSIHLILEFVDGGTVQQQVKAQKRLSESETQRVMWQLVDAVTYCHGAHVCHRDLKLENFMLHRSGRSLKLIDFGLSVIWRAGQQLFKSYGTPCYMAPEIVQGKNYSGAAVDVWSLGVAFATMLSGSLPFQGAGDSELKRKILRGAFTIPDYVCADARDLLQRMLHVNPEQRIDMAGIKRHPFLSQYFADGPRSGADEPKPTGGAEAAAEGAPGPKPVANAPKLDEPLDAAVMSKMVEIGFDANEVRRESCRRDTAAQPHTSAPHTLPAPLCWQVEQAVRQQTYTHEQACYEMLKSASAAQKSARGERH